MRFEDAAGCIVSRESETGVGDEGARSLEARALLVWVSRVADWMSFWNRTLVCWRPRSVRGASDSVHATRNYYGSRSWLFVIKTCRAARIS